MKMSVSLDGYVAPLDGERELGTYAPPR